MRARDNYKTNLGFFSFVFGKCKRGLGIGREMKDCKL